MCVRALLEKLRGLGYSTVVALHCYHLMLFMGAVSAHWDGAIRLFLTPIGEWLLNEKRLVRERGREASPSRCRYRRIPRPGLN